MKSSSRAVVFAAFGVGPLLLLAGCGDAVDGSGSEVTLLEIQPTSFVELPPATTTTTTAVPTDTTPGRAPGEQTYTIRAGDTLGGIARRFDIGLDQLIGYNEFANGANQLILPGDTIRIPPGGAVPGATETADASDTADTGESDVASDTDTADDADGSDATEASDAGTGCTHTIAAGEFPNRVARQYDISYEQLQAANPAMDMTTTFVVGDTLVIPPEGDCG